MRTLAARRICQTALGTFLKCVKELDQPKSTVLWRVLQHLLCPGNSASPWFAASCCRDGSLAVILPIWAGRASVGRNSQSSPYGSVRPRLACDAHASVRALGVEKEGPCSSTCAATPMAVGRGHCFRNLCAYQGRAPRWVGPSAGISGSTTA